MRDMKRRIAAAALAFGAVWSIAFGAHAQDAPAFSECAAAVDDAALRKEVSSGAAAAMSSAAETLNYEAIVLDAWRASRFDRRFERIVDDKIEELRSDTNYVERLVDANVPSYAEEIAEKTAKLVFESPEFEELQQSLMTEIGQRLEPAVADVELAVSGQAAECIQVYLGARYSDIVQGAFARELTGATSIDVSVDGSDAGTAAAISLSGVVAALLVIAFRRVVRRVVSAMVQRLAGAIAARLASWVSVITGVIVLSYELIAGAEGIFPEIRDTLLSNETRTEIQRAVVDELKTVGVQTLERRSTAVADAMIARWDAFKQNHARVLELAAKDEAFGDYLGRLRPQMFEKLSALVAVMGSDTAGGDEAALEAFRSGLLERAMRIPRMEVLAEEFAPKGVTVAELIAWADLGGARFRRSLDFDLPTVTDPDTLNEETLGKLLALDTPREAQTIATLPLDVRGEVLALDLKLLRILARDFSGAGIEALMTVARSASTPERRNDLLETAVANPGSARALANPATAKLVSSSRSPGAALGVLLDTASLWNPAAFIDHLTLVTSGDVSPLVIPHRYGWLTAIIFGVPAIIMIGFLRTVGRVVAPRRRRRDRSALLD